MTSSIELIEKSTNIENNEANDNSSKLLLIEPKDYLSDTLNKGKLKSNYQVTRMLTEESNRSGLSDYLLDHNPDMIVLELDGNERTNLKSIRDVRVLFEGLLIVVANKHDETEQIEAFRLGVDDYLERPENSQLLIMRIASLIRRKNDKSLPVELASITLGDVCLLPQSQKCLINGDAVKLTTFEFNLVTFLLEHPDQVLSRDMLYFSLLGRTYNGVERTLDVRMSQLREKLTFAGMKKNQIETVWGQGYMLSH